MADDLSNEDAATLNIGSIISQKLSESIKNADVVSMLQNIAASSPGDDESNLIKDRIQQVLEKYNLMSEEDKQTMQEQMKEMLVQKLSSRLKDYNVDMTPLQEAIGEAIVYHLYIMAAIVLFVVLLLVFFGYKLYKSIKEKEKKREEKKKAKMTKKKK